MVCCGHSHKLKVEKLENIKGSFTYLVNPGTIGGVGRSPATYIVADLDSMSFESREISKQIERDAGYY
ncbi:MAG: hypothetical protein B6D72_00290 [gamma proteobacterium symbiont of Ctena orbiculata]|nr:MAG: hypothetical protein B6D72_00290 [gamma proteobacterium symbiont of Ctena orbiculata]